MYPDYPYYNFPVSKCNETLLRTLHAEVRIFTVYAKYMAPPTKSMSEMAVKILERERAAAGVSIEKNDKTSVSKDR